MCKQSINIKLYSFLLAASFSPSRPGLVKMCHILWCLEGVWEVSVGCLSDSRYCLGGYDVQAIDKHPIRLISISCFNFSQLPRIGQNCAIVWCVCRVSELCLGGVCGLSE